MAKTNKTPTDFSEQQPILITDKKLEDFNTLTIDQDKEVPLYNHEGDVAKFWRARRYDAVVVVTHRAPGKHEKLVSITDFGKDFSAKRWIDQEAEARGKRIPIIRKEKAEAKLLKLIRETNTEILKLVAWAKNGNGAYLWKTRDQILKRHENWDHLQKGTEAEHISSIMEMLRKKGDSYFGGLKLARRFIDQIKPGGMADQIHEGVIEGIEKNLIPWAYVAGYLGADVMLANTPKVLAIKLIERHANPIYVGNLGFYPEGTTVEGIVERVVSQFDDVKPEVLDALTLE